MGGPSRLDCLKETIIEQINQMRMNNDTQNRKVGIVTFGDEVRLIGDGTNHDVYVSDEYLMDEQFLLK